MTCLSEGHWDIDAQTFAEWGVGADTPLNPSVLVFAFVVRASSQRFKLQPS